MTPVTHLTAPRPSPVPPPAPDDVPVQGRRSAALATAFVRGGVAACLGIGALAVLVTAVWISSPYPDGGADSALHTSAGLWLLAHGADLIRTDTVSGVPAPLGVTPLLLCVLPMYLAHRAARDTLDPGDTRPVPSPAGAVAAVTGGYLLVAAVVVIYTEAGAFPADLVSAGCWTPVTVFTAACVGAWSAHGRPLPGRGTAADALGAAGHALAALLGAGGLLVVGALLWHVGAVQMSLGALAGEWSGRLAVTLLALVLLPNAVVWGVAYGLGPGFVLGTGALVGPFGPLGHTATPARPDFPLLAALPGPGPAGWAHWAAGAVPVLAGLALGRRAGRSAHDRPARHAALAALGAAGFCGVAVALLTALAGGPLGAGRLAAFGPVWWQTGPAAALWCAVLGVPTALVVRAWGRWSARRATAARAVAARVMAAPVPAPAGKPGVGKPEAGKRGAGKPDAEQRSVRTRSARAWDVRTWGVRDRGARAWGRLVRRGGPPGPPSAAPTPGARPAPLPVPAPSPVHGGASAGALARLDALEALDALEGLDDDTGEDGYGVMPAAWEPPKPG
ncbi:integral membrane protein [Streptomyces laurentii]|uniref:Integral membrane protein n=1 Tax=Streptomyces laurentii TaxID=39478 RepID=A0A160P241_STRLU|nr:integral membrane protein [Streptomyces laurentii]